MSSYLVFTNGRTMKFAVLSTGGFRSVKETPRKTRGIASGDNKTWAIDYLLTKGYELIGTIELE